MYNMIILYYMIYYITCYCMIWYNVVSKLFIICYNKILYNILIYNMISYYIMEYYIIFYNIVIHYLILYCIMWYYMKFFWCIIWSNTIIKTQYNTVLYDTISYLDTLSYVTIFVLFHYMIQFYIVSYNNSYDTIMYSIIVCNIVFIYIFIE